MTNRCWILFFSPVVLFPTVTAPNCPTVAWWNCRNCLGWNVSKDVVCLWWPRSVLPSCCVIWEPCKNVISPNAMVGFCWFCRSIFSFLSFLFVAEETTHSLRFVTPNTVGAICIHIYDWVILRHFVPSLLHSNFVASIPFLLSSLFLSVFLCAVCSDFCCFCFIVTCTSGQSWFCQTGVVFVIAWFLF